MTKRMKLSILAPLILSLLPVVAAGAPPAAGGAIVTGTDVGLVGVFDADGREVDSVQEHPSSFMGGVRVAVGDVTGDGTSDIVTAPGPGGGPHIQVTDGESGRRGIAFLAFDPSFLGGVFVGTGDVNGDGRADIITGPDAGGGPNVRVFDGTTGAQMMSFFAYDPSFRGGVRVAAGDVNGDGRADIITAPGTGGGPNVRVFDGASGRRIVDFIAGGEVSAGLFVAAGDLNADGFSEVIVGAGEGSLVRVLDGSSGREVSRFSAYDERFTGGVRVGADDVNGDGIAEIVTGAGAGGGPHVKVFDGWTGEVVASFLAHEGAFSGGVFVAAGAL